jgi:acyl carrier protein
MTTVSPNITHPVSIAQIRALMKTIPSWAKIESGIKDDVPFQNSGMDSLALLELVSELQRLTGLEIPDDDVERISTINGLARYLNEKLE